MNIIIRTDASVEIGTGHVMRCLTLADALRSKGAIISFICRELSGSLCDFLAARGYVVHRLDGLNSANKGSIFQKTPHSHWLNVNWNADAEQLKQFLLKKRCGMADCDQYYALIVNGKAGCANMPIKSW